MLKLAIISDMHLGFSLNGTDDDSFDNFEQALGLALGENPQMILLGGDIFHDRIPKQEVMGKALELFSKANKAYKNFPKITKQIKGKQAENTSETIPPIVAIWGTHELRHFGGTNPVQVLEKAGLLKCLHAESILVESGGEKVGIHGLSGVPEAHAKEAMALWAPQPFTDCYNILLVHQNIKELMPMVEHALSFSDLPKDFITFCGHIHNTSQHRHPASKNPIIVVGSTVMTQMQKIESETKKGFYILELSSGKCDLKFFPIKTRPFFYETISIDGKKPMEILQELDLKLAHFTRSADMKPAVRIVLEGRLADGFKPEDLNISKLNLDYEDKLILSIEKSKITASDFEAHSKLLSEIREKKLSVDEIGIEMLLRNLKLGISPAKLSTIFHLLAEGNMEFAEDAIDSKYEPAILEETKPEAKPEARPALLPIISKPVPSANDLKQKSFAIQLMPAQVRAPEPVQVQKSGPAPDPETERLAETGLSALGFGSGGGSKSSARPASPSRASPTPAQQQGQPKKMLTSSGELLPGIAESGLSMLGRSDKKPVAAIRLKTEPGGKPVTIDYMKRAPVQEKQSLAQKYMQDLKAKYAGPSALAPAPAPRRQNIDDMDFEPRKKPAFDVTKWLNKEL
ncbi:MAG: metallophosphoesterase [Nanoarchaeota archaeon]